VIKTVSALSLAFFLVACGGGSKATKTEPAGADPNAAPAAEAAPLPANEAAPTGDATAAQPTGDAEAAPFTEADWEAVVVFTEKVADVVDANKDDCDAMATNLQNLLDENAELIARANAWQKTASKEDQARFNEKYADRFQAMGMKLAPGFQACQSHAGVQAQFKRFE